MADADADFALMLSEADTAFARSVTVTRRVTGDFSPTTQRRVTTDTSSGAISARLQPRRITPGNSQGMDVEESIYHITATNISFAPIAGDTLVDGSSTYHISRVERDVNDLEYICFCRLSIKR